MTLIIENDDYTYDGNAHAKKLKNLVNHMREKHSLPVLDDDYELLHNDFLSDSADHNKQLIKDYKKNKNKNYSKDTLIGAVDDVFKRRSKPLEHSISTYSGTTYDPRKQLEGNIHTVPSYLHTSLNPFVASEFSLKGTYKNKERHIAHFALPKGYNKGLYLDSTPYAAADEMEYAMPRKTKWRLIKSQQIKPSAKLNRGYSDVDFGDQAPDMIILIKEKN